VVCTDKFKEVWEVEYLPDCTYETAVRISNMGLFYLMVNVGCKGELHAIVQMVASEEVATTFKYKVNVSSISGHKRVTYSNEVSIHKINIVIFVSYKSSLDSRNLHDY
jgi:hypothetical protein